MVRRRRNVCIFHGRFQPFHIGHLSVLDYLVTNTSDDILIGIINPDPQHILPGDDDKFIRFSPEKNPLSFWERYHCIDLVIKAHKWTGRIAGIVPLPRPSVNLEMANCYIPPGPRSFIICNRGNDEIETWKKEQYEKSGERVLTVSANMLPPLCLIVSGELIRCLIALNNQYWKELVPGPAAGFMEAEKLDLKIARNISSERAKSHLRKLLEEGPLPELAVELFPQLYEELHIALGSANESIPPSAACEKLAIEEVDLGVSLDAELAKESSPDALSKAWTGPKPIFITGDKPTIEIKGDQIMRDKYTAGQAGAQGPRSHAHDIAFTQIWGKVGGSIDLNVLAKELGSLRERLREEAATPEHDAEIGALANAEISAKQGNGPRAFEWLSKASRWAFNTATQIGVRVAAEALKVALGL